VAINYQTLAAKVNLEDGKPRAYFECTLESAGERWRATAVLRNRLGVILDRQMKEASTQWAARVAATDALSTRWAWRLP
jgi:hypothetical protein